VNRASPYKFGGFFELPFFFRVEVGEKGPDIRDGGDHQVALPSYDTLCSDIYA
jgi:hypothetical protein